MATATADHVEAPWLSEETIDEIEKENVGNYVNLSKLEADKEHRFRFFGTGITGWETWTTDNKPIRFRLKPTNDELPSNTKLVDGAPQLKRFLAGIVWDAQQETFRIMQITQKSVMGRIFECSKDSDYGDPTKYDIKITRTGSGKETEYKVMPSPPSAPNKKLVAAFAELTCDLSAMFEGADPFASPST